MKSYAEAIALIESLGPATTAMHGERVPLADAAGRVLAEDLRATIPSPPFTNSAMDGFAVRHAEATSGPLTIAGTLFARRVTPEDERMPPPGACMRIMTGAVVPPWADTVIPVEQAVIEGDRVTFREVPKQGSHIRVKGEDLPEGCLVLPRGTWLDSERLMIAAAFGYPELAVLEQPRILILSTGDELVAPGETLAPGTIYNSSSVFLAAAARDLGLKDVRSVWVPDDEARASMAVDQAIEAARPTLILSTGAVSAGERDFIPDLARRLGFVTIFHKVAIRPGKPVFLARRGCTLWLGLPGNAVSTCVGWHAFARPLLASWAGLPGPQKRTVTLRNPVKKPEGLRCFYRAEIRGDEAWVGGEQGSARLAATVAADAYVELPEGRAAVPADTKVTAIIIR